MEYEVKNTEWVSVPKQKESDPTKVEIYVNVTTGVVGDTYGFTKTDTFLAECEMTMTGAQMKQSVDTQAIVFSNNKYPNT